MEPRSAAPLRTPVMDPVALSLVVNILSIVFVGWFFVMVLQHMSRSQRAASGKDADALKAALAETEAETARLRQRLEAVEAIVTDEGFDLERDARRALTGGPLASALVFEPDEAGPEEAARPQRRRVR